MSFPAPSPSDCDAMLTELAGLGMRAARVIAEMMEIEREAARVVAGWLPVPGVRDENLNDALIAGQSVDGVEAAMATAVPRVEVLARALDRVSRAVRRSVALKRRLEAGWPRAGSADDRQAMVRRQVARGVTEVIRQAAAGETAERLFDDLAERLEEPGFDEAVAALPVEEVVRRICRDLGLATRGMADGLPPRVGDVDTG